MRKLLALIACAWLAVGIPAALAGSAYTPPKTSATTGYTPASGANWSDPDPTTAASALDTLAARVPVAGGIGGTTGAADNRVLRSDGVGGLTAQASPLECTDAGDVSGVAGLTLSGNITMSGVGATVDGVDVGALATTVSSEVAVSQSGTGACGASQWVSTLNSDAAPTCSQPAFTDISGAVTDAQVPNTITVDLAAAATALAANPADCAAGQYATTIAASGALTCAQPAFSELSGVCSIAQGGTTETASTEDAVLVGASTTDWEPKVLPSCSDATNSKLLYNSTTNTFSCGADQTGGAIDASVVTYTPASVNYWPGDADPGDVDQALDAIVATYPGTVAIIDNNNSPYTIAYGTGVVSFDSTFGAVDMTLPSVADDGQQVTIIKRNSAGSAATVDAAGAQTINGTAGAITFPTAQWSAKTYRANGNNWYVVGGSIDALPTYAQTADATLTAWAAISYTAGTEIKTLTAADTFGTLNVGTAANNIVQLNGSAELPAVSGANLTSLPAKVNVQTFTVGGGDTTWEKPTGAVWIEVYLVGGGGGGGSGRWSTAAENRYGGCGGGGGGFTRAWLAASAAGATETVTVGAGGTGGTAAASSGNDGNAGAAGAATTFGSLLRAGGGGAGCAGSTTAGTPGAGGTGWCAGGAGTAGAIGASPASAGNLSSCGQGAGGGAGGSGISSAPASTGSGADGGAGASSYYAWSASGLTGGTAGVGANNDRSGGNGTGVTAGHVLGGAGGGSGGARASAGGDNAAGGGGAGGIYGGGGGGSGALGFAGTARAGGAGADGYALVVTYY